MQHFSKVNSADKSPHILKKKRKPKKKCKRIAKHTYNYEFRNKEIIKWTLKKRLDLFQARGITVLI